MQARSQRATNRAGRDINLVSTVIENQRSYHCCCLVPLHYLSLSYPLCQLGVLLFSCSSCLLVLLSVSLLLVAKSPCTCSYQSYDQACDNGDSQDKSSRPKTHSQSKAKVLGKGSCETTCFVPSQDFPTGLNSFHFYQPNGQRSVLLSK